MAQLRYVFQVLVSVQPSALSVATVSLGADESSIQPVSQASPNSGTASLGADQSSVLWWSSRTTGWFIVPVSSGFSYFASDHGCLRNREQSATAPMHVACFI